MRTFLVYLKLELKRALKSAPYFLAGTAVLAVLVGLIAFAAGRVLYSDRAVGISRWESCCRNRILRLRN